MPSEVSPQWHEKASDFFSSSGVKLKEARQTAGPIVEEVAKDAKEKVVDVAGKVGSMMKSRWSIIQQAAQRPRSKEAMQERLICAAASTGTLLRKGITETKDKVAVGKLKVEEVAKKTAQKSKTILTNIERMQKGVAGTDVFGVPIEVTVQRQESSRPLPHVVVKCADYLVLSGLNTEYLFKYGGDKKTIQQLISVFNEDWNASLPEGVTPLDVATLCKCYLASLPEPLTTFVLYHEIRSARSSIHSMRNILKKLPNVNYMTLEFITALLLRVSQKSILNKMDARSLAMEMAPLIIWQKGQKPDYCDQYFHQSTKVPSKKAMDLPPTYSAWDTLSEEDDGIDVSSAISLDDGLPTDFSAIEVVQCLIEHHNAIFTDANETIWR
ncbi:Rho gtpase-activating protein gacjj [Thalictrum thalictroides]|uniref:Rho gtpase-activating protein gacjj n=1 Tax=Thalictrum thalictroides TaxID=46969 RepID=A0A7J6V966_THATH|nr:Rho gtpase-activating protein gacjj [Thalictrum thalictroides]